MILLRDGEAAIRSKGVEWATAKEIPNWVDVFTLSLLPVLLITCRIITLRRVPMFCSSSEGVFSLWQASDCLSIYTTLSNMTFREDCKILSVLYLFNC